MYPAVLSEVETIDRLVAGEWRGFARFGDGDFNLLRGQRDRYHKACPHLAHSLAQSLATGSDAVLNGLIPPPPVMKEGTLAYQRWVMYLEMNAGLIPLLPAVTYGSSNISRMDSCPHLHTTSWYRSVARLWQGKDICLVRGTERSLTSGKLMESHCPPASVVEVICKPQDNFSQLDEIYDEVRGINFETVILCAGLLSRPLVHELVTADHLAYDVGHLGMYFRGGNPIPLADCPR